VKLAPCITIDNSMTLVSPSPLPLGLLVVLRNGEMGEDDDQRYTYFSGGSELNFH
jgi:hypothetical protein